MRKTHMASAGLGAAAGHFARARASAIRRSNARGPIRSGVRDVVAAVVLIVLPVALITEQLAAQAGQLHDQMSARTVD
jgi:hypothetical protein